MTTRTGKFPIGFRRRSSTPWQKDLNSLIKWARTNDLEAIDLERDGDRGASAVIEAGLKIGSVDILEQKAMLSPDRGKRTEAIARNTDYIRACAAHGPINHFVIMLPEDPQLPRKENFAYMVDSFAQLVPILEENQACIAIEGWPGPGALCCTPEVYRAFFKEIPSKAMGINYDPSHLVRQGIDPVRFLEEFAVRVYHFHGKDTEILPEGLYEFGHEQPATFAERIPYGDQAWRYTIPGHGIVPWVKLFRILKEHGYSGCVSVELEDGNFHRVAEAEQLGIVQGARFLEGC